MKHAGVMGTALMTDLYELTMLDAALRSGVASRRATFEVFARRLPQGRGYGVVAGPGRLADQLALFQFSPDQIDYLAGLGRFSEELLEHLESFRFEGEVWSYREGDLYVPGSPVLRVDCSFGAGLLLETLVLSVLNHDCAVASAAARMHDAANGRHLIEMGGGELTKKRQLPQLERHGSSGLTPRQTWRLEYVSVCQLQERRRTRSPWHMMTKRPRLRRK